MGRHSQHREAHVHAMHVSDWKGWSQEPSPPSAYLRVGSGGISILLDIPASWRLSKGKQIFFPCFCIWSCCVWACPHLLWLRTLLLFLFFPLCYSITDKELTKYLRSVFVFVFFYSSSYECFQLCRYDLKCVSNNTWEIDNLNIYCTLFVADQTEIMK